MMTLGDGNRYKLIHGDAYEKLCELPSDSVDCCVTSPPYYALRDYGYEGQIGLENTPEAYIDRLVMVFREMRRVLKPQGTCWINIGDSYWGSGSRGCDLRDYYERTGVMQGTSKGTGNLSNIPKLQNNVGVYKNKDLIGIPWMLAFALRADGWYLRQDIVWAKPNCMPESVTDRCTKSHEYIFMLTKQPKYYFDVDAIKEKASTPPTIRDKNAEGYKADYPHGDRFSPGARVYGKDGKRNKRDVWFVPGSSGYTDDFGAHYATYSTKLIEPCILAGCPSGGEVLDMFNGTGTTGVVALKNGRKYIGIDMSKDYIEMAAKRIERETAQMNIFEMMEV